MIKSKWPDVIVCTDIALDPYSDQGHDGVVKNGKILNVRKPYFASFDMSCVFKLLLPTFA